MNVRNNYDIQTIVLSIIIFYCYLTVNKDEYINWLIDKLIDWSIDFIWLIEIRTESSYLHAGDRVQ